MSGAVNALMLSSQSGCDPGWVLCSLALLLESDLRLPGLTGSAAQGPAGFRGIHGLTVPWCAWSIGNRRISIYQVKREDCE